jgi:polygalacturonase
MGTDVGLRFKSTRGRGGVVEKIRITNVRMTDITSDAINCNLYYGGQAPSDETAGTVETNTPPVTEGTPQFRDIQIENVICRGAQKAVVLEGLPEMPIRDITLKNVSISANAGVFVTDADGIKFDNVRVTCKTGPALTQLRVKNSSLELVK